MKNSTDPQFIWHIALFGEMKFYRVHPVEKTYTPVAVRFKTSKARLLLAYLLLHPDQPHSREYLAALFWPGNVSTGRDRLRDALTSIRNALREAEIPDEILLTTNSTVRIAVSDGFLTDVAAFDRALLRAKPQRPDQTADECIAALEEAVALYSGPLLHADVDIKDADEWIVPMRNRYTLLFDDTLPQLTTLYAAQDDVKRALFYARRSAESNPSEPETAEMVRVLSERLQQRDRANVTRLLAERNVSPEPVIDTVSPASAPAPAQHTVSPIASPHASDATPPLASSDHLPSPPAPQNRPFRRLLSVGTLASAILLGVFGGMQITRMHVPTKSPSQQPASEVPPELDPKHFYDNRIARAMKNKDYDAALGYYRRALPLKTTRDERVQIALGMRELGKSAYYLDKVPGLAIAAFEEALSIFRKEEDTPNIADTFIILANEVILRGERQQSIKYMEQASRTIATMERSLAKADDLQQVVEWAVDVGEYKQVNANLNAALAIAQSGTSEEHQKAVAFLRWNQGCYESEMGDYTAAKTHLIAAAAQMAGFQDQAQTRAAVLGDLGDVYVREGDTAKADACYREGLQVWETPPNDFWVANFKARLADLSLVRAETIGHATQTRPAGTTAGQTALHEAEQLCRESLKLLEASTHPVARARPLLVLGRVRYYQNHRDEANKMIQEGVGLRKRVGNPLRVAEALEALALFESQVGDYESGRGHAQEAEGWRKEAGTSIIPPRDRVNITGMRVVLGLPPIK